MEVVETILSSIRNEYTFYMHLSKLKESYIPSMIKLHITYDRKKYCINVDRRSIMILSPRINEMINEKPHQKQLNFSFSLDKPINHKIFRKSLKFINTFINKFPTFKNQSDLAKYCFDISQKDTNGCVTVIAKELNIPMIEEICSQN